MAQRNDRRRPDRRKQKNVRNSAKDRRNRRPRRPLAPERDEDMLSEFSDETNTFYTDERVERKKRVKEENQRKKKAKKAEKRKPISPMRRKIRRILSYVAIVVVVIMVGIVLSLTVLFKTQVFEITGNTHYAEADISAASGIKEGENIFLAPKGTAEKHIKAQFPYVEDVRVTFAIPDTIKIAITEAVPGYYVKLSDTDYLVISTKGRILERTADRKAFSLPLFIGPTPVTGEPGDYVSYEDETVVQMIDSITQTFADNGYQGITEIDATKPGDIYFTYNDRIKVRLGIPEDISYKIRTAMAIINEKLDKNQTGTIQGLLDVSRCNSTKRSYFNEMQISTPDSVAPTQATEAVQDDSGESWTDDSQWTWTDDSQWTDDTVWSDDAYYGY